MWAGRVVHQVGIGWLKSWMKSISSSGLVPVQNGSSKTSTTLTTGPMARPVNAACFSRRTGVNATAPISPGDSARTESGSVTMSDCANQGLDVAGAGLDLDFDFSGAPPDRTRHRSEENGALRPEPLSQRLDGAIGSVESPESGRLSGLILFHLEEPLQADSCRIGGIKALHVPEQHFAFGGELLARAATLKGRCQRAIRAADLSQSTPYFVCTSAADAATPGRRLASAAETIRPPRASGHAIRRATVNGTI